MKKFSNAVMLLLLIAAIFVFYTEMMPIKIAAGNLAGKYSENKAEADKTYLGKELEVTGIVKAYYKVLDIRNVLEFDNENNNINLFCFFLNESDEYKASLLNEGDTITVIGNCAGMDKYNFLKGLKIEVKKIK